MINSLRVNGLRSLLDTGYIDLKPLTIVLGKNSSGKSSFLRTFPLFKQSVEVSTKGPILWFGKYVDFGTYDEAQTINSDTGEISFSFKIDIPKIDTSYFYDDSDEVETFECECKQNITKNSSNETVSNLISLKFLDNQIDLELKESNVSDTHYEVMRILINGVDYLDEFNSLKCMSESGKFFSEIFFLRQKDGRYFRTNGRISNYIFNVLRKDYVRSNTSEAKIEFFLQNFMIDSFDNFKTNVFTQKRINFLKLKKLEKIDQYRKLKELYNLLLLINMNRLLRVVSREFTNFSESVQYIKPIRASAERYYRKQDLAVDEIDSAGTNVAMYLSSLPRRRKQTWENWTIENFGFKIVASLDGGHVSLKLFYENDKKGTNLADLGFGFSQILPILVQLWSYRFNNRNRNRLIHRQKVGTVLVIEQPELHLHPAYQSKLAEIFVKVLNGSLDNRHPLKIVIETHSQTIVNKLGELVQTKSIDEKNLSVLLFDKKGEKTNIQTTFYDEEGYIKNWPVGFFE